MKRTAIILALALFVAGAIFLRGRGRVLAPVDSEVRSLTATGAGVFWIQAPAEPGQAPAELLYVPHGGGRPACLLREWDIRSLWVDGSRLYALLETGPEQDSGQCLIRDLRTGEDRRFRGLQRPQGIWAGRDQLVWAEARDARAAGVVHVPIIRPVHVLRVGCQTPENARLLTLTEGAQPHFTGLLLGEHGTAYYWQESVGGEFAEGITAIRRGFPGEDPETLVRTRGQNTSVLVDDRLWWTAYSEERDRPDSGRIARTMKTDGDEPRTVTDWLPSGGRLIALDSAVYCAGQGLLWRVPERLSEPVPVAAGSFSRADTTAVWASNLYVVTAVEDKQMLVRVPMGLGGVMRAALAFGRLNTKKVGGQ